MENIFEIGQDNFSLKLYESQGDGMNMGRMIGSNDCTIVTFPYCHKYSDYHQYKDHEDFFKSLLATKLHGKRNALAYIRKVKKSFMMLSIPVEVHETLLESTILQYLSDEFVIQPLFMNTVDDSEHISLSTVPLTGHISKKIGWAYVARIDVKEKNECFDAFSRNFLEITIERELEELNALLSGRYYYASLTIGEVQYHLPIIYADKDSAIGMMKSYFERISNLPELLSALSFDPLIEYHGYCTRKTPGDVAALPKKLNALDMRVEI